MRPTERPSQPMSLDEIKRAVHRHFVVEKNPICTDGRGCFYGRTGCFVGCLLTEEDAKRLDNNGDSTSLYGVTIQDGRYCRSSNSNFTDTEIKRLLIKLMNIYFEPSVDILHYLYRGQSVHDSNNLTDLISYINNRPPVNGF